MIDIQTLGTGIKSLYDGSSGAALRALTGNNKLFQGLAPQGTAFPYIVFTMISDNPDDTFNAEQSVCRVQFSIFTKLGSASVIGEIARELKALYHGTALPFPNHYGHIGTVALPSHDLGIDQNNIHHVILDFQIWTYKQTLQDASFGDLAELTFGDLAERTIGSFALSVWK